ncbi:MAG: DUF2497 domain-containing protein [Alphaproteobacteria bacterium]|nr:DUF2497 domain-containing protein [Alphaproteobacteria bacterium]
MTQAQAQPEPSMEEILASIRRIISEEEETPETPVLELSEPAESPEPELPALEPVEDVFDPPAAAEDDVLVFETPSEPAAPAEPIISQPAMSQAASAMSRLAGTLRIAETQGQTLEGVVRELLKPMLREWLDAHLPEIVEAKVEAELERIARLAR